MTELSSTELRLTEPTDEYGSRLDGAVDQSWRCYILARWRIRSDFPFTELGDGVTGDAPALVVSRHTSPFPNPTETLREVGDPASERGWIRLVRCEDGLQWHIGGLGRFWVVADGSEVRYDLIEGHDPSDAEQALVGPVLATALQLQGVLVLHASALVAGGSAFAVSAPSGYGKSTLSTALTRRGARLLTDDVLPLERSGDGYLALPYLPRLKLWADSLEAFGMDGEPLARVTSWADKRRIPLDPESGLAISEPTRLAVVYMLAPTTEAVVPAIADLSPVEAVLALQGALYQPELMTSQRAASALTMVADLAGCVRVRRLTFRRGYEWLEAAGEAVLTDVAALVETAQ